MYRVRATLWRTAGQLYAKSHVHQHVRNASKSSSYDFKPLQSNETRVLNLFPGRFGAPLRCTMRNVSLTLRPPYESLSYCWGRNRHEEIVHCDNGILHVTKNLFSALQHLRHEDGPRTLWIDALCVNQADLQERASQVDIMKNIFRLGKRTVVWLGDEGHDSHLAVQLLHQLASAWRTRASQARISHESLQLPPLYDRKWSALVALLQRPWWHRAWIVQEISVPEDILLLCGKEIFRWKDLERAIEHAVDLGVFIAYGGSTTFQAFTLFQSRARFRRRNLPSLHYVLLHNRSFLATDPRDKVFSLLSLANPGNIRTLGIRPDYHQSPQQLFKNVTLSLLECNGLSALRAAGIHEHSFESEAVPSWVSDWSIPDLSIPLDSLGSTADKDISNEAASVPSFSASRSTTLSPEFDEEKNYLGLEGMLVDEVAAVGALSRTRYLRHVSHMFELFVQCHDTLEQMKDWEIVARVLSKEPYPTGEKQREAYWQTLCVGRAPRGMKSAYNDPRYKYYVLIRSLRLFVRVTLRWFPRSTKDTWYNRFFYSLFQSAWRVFGLTPAKIQRIGFPPESSLSNHRRMIRTKSGYIALAPRHTKVGDWVSICKGGQIPFIVRKDGDHWVLVGESYVHGIMYGEAWDETKCEPMWIK